MNDAVPMLQLDGLVRRYPNGVLAADGVSFEVQRGEVHALVGENGAGNGLAKGRFSGAILADQSMYFAGVEVKIDRFDGVHAAINLVAADDLQHRLGGG